MTERFFILILITLFYSCKNRDKATKYVLCTDNALNIENEKIVYKNEPFTGIIYAMYTSEDTLFRETYLEGVKHGLTLKWHSNGKVWQQLIYTQSLPDSTHSCWWENGRKKFEINYKKGKLHGVWEGWYPSGMRRCMYNYQNGEEEGTHSEWAIDGRPHISYRVTNGKVTNFIISKSCVYVQ